MIGIAVFAAYVFLGILAHAVYTALEKSLDAYANFAFRDIPDTPSSSKPLSETDKWWLRWACFWFWPFPTAFVLFFLFIATIVALVFRLPTLYVEWIRSKPWEGWSKRWSEWYHSERIVEKKPPTWGGF